MSKYTKLEEGAESKFDNDSNYLLIEVEEDVSDQDLDQIMNILESTLEPPIKINDSAKGTSELSLLKQMHPEIFEKFDIYHQYRKEDDTHHIWAVYSDEDFDLRQKVYDAEYEINKILDRNALETHVIERKSDPNLDQIPEAAEEIDIFESGIGPSNAQSV